MKTAGSGYIDLRPLKEEVEGNMSICKKLMESFLIDIEEYVYAMRGTLQTNNWPELYHVAHKIIPSIRIFNIIALEPIVMQLETNLRDQTNMELINTNIDSSLHIFNQVKQELQNELKLIDDAAT